MKKLLLSLFFFSFLSLIFLVNTKYLVQFHPIETDNAVYNATKSMLDSKIMNVTKDDICTFAGTDGGYCFFSPTIPDNFFMSFKIYEKDTYRLLTNNQLFSTKEGVMKFYTAIEEATRDTVIAQLVCISTVKKVYQSFPQADSIAVSVCAHAIEQDNTAHTAASRKIKELLSMTFTKDEKTN